jgi:putative redox protein
MQTSNVRSVRLRWTGQDLVFRGGADGGPEVVVDGGSKAGASPMQLLLLSVAGCMAIDVKVILDKSRVPLDSMEVEVVGERAETEPQRFFAIQLIYRLSGPLEEHEVKLQRAIDLSRDKYCSVLHTLDPGIDFDISIERS